MRKSRVIGAISIVVVLLATFSLIFQPFEINDATVSFSLRSDTKVFLENLSTPEGATEISAIKVTNADGTMPEMALRSFKINSNSNLLQQFYFRKCQETSLSEPEKDHLRVEPEMICEGRKQVGIMKVYLYPKCTNSLCNVNVEVRLWNL